MQRFMNETLSQKHCLHRIKVVDLMDITPPSNLYAECSGKLRVLMTCSDLQTHDDSSNLSLFLLTPRKECAFCSTLSIPVSTNHNRVEEGQWGDQPFNAQNLEHKRQTLTTWWPTLWICGESANSKMFSGHISKTHMIQRTLKLTSASRLTIVVFSWKTWLDGSCSADTLLLCCFSLWNERKLWRHLMPIRKRSWKKIKQRSCQ